MLSQRRNDKAEACSRHASQPRFWARAGGPALLLVAGMLASPGACIKPRNGTMSPGSTEADASSDVPVSGTGASGGVDRADRAPQFLEASVGTDQTSASLPVDASPGAANGQRCQDRAECASQYCVDGVCCESACQEVCRSCAIADHIGTCNSIVNGVDADTCSGTDSVCAGSDTCAVLDQRQDLFDATFNVGQVSVGQSPVQAQTIAPGRDGRLMAVRLKGHCPAGVTLTAQIQAVANGQPNGVVVSSQVLSADKLAGNIASPQLLVFDSPVVVKPAVPFALVLRTAGGFCSFTGTNTDGYPAGTHLSSPQGQIWQPFLGDITFQTFVAP